MKAILSDFFILMIIASLCGTMFHLILKLIHRKYHTCANQVYVNHKIILLFYMIAPLVMTYLFLNGRSLKYVAAPDGDFHGFVLISLPISYQFYDKYHEFDLLPYAFAIWLTGAVFVFTLYNIRNWHRIKKLKRISIKNMDSRLEQQKNLLQKEYHITRKIQIYNTDVISSPFITGIRKPEIFLPRMEFSEKHLEFILRHELIHCQKKDILFRQLLLCVISLFWFNPLIYLFAADFCGNCEIACDEILISQIPHGKQWEYAKCIVEFSHSDKHLRHVVGLYSESILEKRLAAITYKRQESGRHIFLLYLTDIVLFFSILCLAAAGADNTRRILAELMESLYFIRVR